MLVTLIPLFDEKMSVRDTEKLVKSLKSPKESKEEKINSLICDLQKY